MGVFGSFFYLEQWPEKMHMHTGNAAISIKLHLELIKVCR